MDVPIALEHLPAGPLCLIFELAAEGDGASLLALAFVCRRFRAVIRANATLRSQVCKLLMQIGEEWRRDRRHVQVRVKKRDARYDETLREPDVRYVFVRHGEEHPLYCFPCWAGIGCSLCCLCVVWGRRFGDHSRFEMRRFQPTHGCDMPGRAGQCCCWTTAICLGPCAQLGAVLVFSIASCIGLPTALGVCCCGGQCGVEAEPGLWLWDRTRTCDRFCWIAYHDWIAQDLVRMSCERTDSELGLPPGPQPICGPRALRMIDGLEEEWGDNCSSLSRN